MGNHKNLDHTDYRNTYEEFIPRKITWNENQDYQDMTTRMIGELLTT